MTAPALAVQPPPPAPHPAPAAAAAGSDQVARLQEAACAAQLAGDGQAVADLIWKIQQLTHTPPSQDEDVTMVRDCPRCAANTLRPNAPTDPNCPVCLGDGALVTGHGRLVYELARQAITDHDAGRTRLTRFIDHSSPSHHCHRCQPRRQASA